MVLVFEIDKIGDIETFRAMATKNGGISHKLGKKSPGSGRVNEVGDNVSVPTRVPKSLVTTVKALRTLIRGKADCPELYMLVVINTLANVTKSYVNTSPIFTIETRPIVMYLEKLMIHFMKIQEDARNEKLELVIDSIEEFSATVEDTFSTESLAKIVTENWDFLESLFKVSKALNFRYSR